MEYHKNKDERVPLILYEKNGQPVYVPPEIADLFRDIPSETDSIITENEDILNCEGGEIGGGFKIFHLI